MCIPPLFLRQIDTLASIKESLVTSKPLGFDDCIVWARLKFQELFHDTIKQLLYNFPPDQLTSSGAPFWSGPKRCPTAHEFSPENPMHMEFIIAAANLRAHVYGLKGGLLRLGWPRRWLILLHWLCD